MRFTSVVKSALALAIAATVVAGCSGGGCASGCAGASVIPGGFPKDQRVQSAAGMRITRPGLDFLEANLGPIVQKVLATGGGAITNGVMTFPIGESSGKVLIFFSYTICPGGPDATTNPPRCTVEIDVAGVKNIKIESLGPHDLRVNADVPVRLRNLPITAIGISMTAGLGVGSASNCGALGYAPVPVTADISLESVVDDAKHAARAGYTRINVKKVDADQKTLQDNFKFCGSGIGAAILNAIKGLILPSVLGGITGKLADPLANATCMQAQKLDDGTLRCPTDTFNVAGTCRYDTSVGAECVPMLLGLESRFDLSGLLASLSPGTSGGLDFMLASAGDMIPAPSTGPADNGVTLGMYGGAIPQPISNCVPQAADPLPTGLTIPDELSVNAIAPWATATPPHVGFALAERHINHIATGSFNSGLFCIGISSEQIPQLEAGIFSLLLKSVNHVSDGFRAPESHPAMGVSIRPQKPPVIRVGDGNDFANPHLDVQMKDTDLDFYMWSEDRFVRLFTGRIDLRVPINLEAGKDGIALKFADPGTDKQSPFQFANPRISNNNLLLEDDAAIRNLVDLVGGLIPTSALGGIKPFRLDSTLAPYGLQLNIPKDGIRKLVKGSDAWLGIFGSLEVAPLAFARTTTTARVVKVAVDPKAFAVDRVGDRIGDRIGEAVGEAPSVAVHASADLDDGSRAVEYAYRVDRGPWSMFALGRDFTARSPMLALQGKHTVFVASRVVGVVRSEGEPVALPVTIDTLPPVVRVQNAVPGTVNVIVGDLVSMPESLKVEARLDGGAWFPVVVGGAVHGRATDRRVQVPEAATEIEVRATDEMGNVSSVSSPLIRGKADAAIAAKAGCGCAVPGERPSKEGGSAATLAALMAIGAMAGRRRTRRTGIPRIAGVGGRIAGTAIVLAIGASGCQCGSGSGEPDKGSVSAQPVRSYVLGSYTSARLGKDGKVWVAGYNEGDPTAASDGFQGDLVVGVLNPATNTVDWKTVDGVPAVKPTRDPDGFRGGVTEPGDDVGLYTTMAIDVAGNPVVGYFDRTHGALRAARFDGTVWTSHEVDRVAKGWAGKFNSMVNVGAGLAIAYQTLEPGADGWAKAKVRVARSANDTPSTTADWKIEDAAVDDKTPCIQAICDAGQKCLAGDRANGVDPVCATTVTGCDAACTEACIKGKFAPRCATIRGQVTAYVSAIGLSISLAAAPAGDLGLVFYDRVHGNLRGASNRGGTWVVTPPTAPLDGWVGDVAKDRGLGDRGIGATLAIDDVGNWHVAYVDGIKEWLLYQTIAGGDLTKPGAPVVVDDGNSGDGTPLTAFSDGNHLIGENAHLTIDVSRTPGTRIDIVYQDSTASTLRWARQSGDSPPKFTRGVIQQEGSAGFFPHIVGGKVVNFFRARGFTVLDAADARGEPVIVGNVRALPFR